MAESCYLVLVMPNSTQSLQLSQENAFLVTKTPNVISKNQVSFLSRNYQKYSNNLTTYYKLKPFVLEVIDALSRRLEWTILREEKPDLNYKEVLMNGCCF